MDMRCVSAALLFVCLLAPQDLLASSDGLAVLKVGYFELQPHIGSAAGFPRGPAIAYLQKIAHAMHVRLEIAHAALPLDRLLNEIRIGKLDVAVGLGRSAEREQILTFPHDPFFYVQPALAVPRAAPFGAAINPAKLKGMRIGAYSSGYLSPLMQGAPPYLESLHGHAISIRNLSKLMAGRLDAVYSPDALDLDLAVKRLRLSNLVRVVPLPEAPVGLYMAFAKHVDASVIASYEDAARRVPSYGHFLKAVPRE